MTFVCGVAMMMIGVAGAGACELCAIYNAANVTGELDRGPVFAISGQYTPYNITLFNLKNAY